MNAPSLDLSVLAAVLTTQSLTGIFFTTFVAGGPTAVEGSAAAMGTLSREGVTLLPLATAVRSFEKRHPLCREVVPQDGHWKC